jgi:hypothetical protein
MENDMPSQQQLRESITKQIIDALQSGGLTFHPLELIANLVQQVCHTIVQLFNFPRCQHRYDYVAQPLGIHPLAFFKLDQEVLLLHN